ncbi:MAG TPA: imidazoleglycerol-phosphate dehydratase HisB [Tepidisphaeraceae bacterium]|jgi:imidazoleglycerol-phosphate dehydratase|nr:imidazoleglycerol-phosphate dehydratase HisB [Tepidisphaeraceae bacterium]
MSSKNAPSARSAKLSRDTKETQIKLSLNLDGSGNGAHETGVGFFDHMLDLFTRHALIDLAVNANGDLHVDPHHTVEDVGITLGQAIEKSLGDKRGIVRYGHASAPMDESLANVSIDLSGRPFLVFNVSFTGPLIGAFPTELVEEFFRALATNAKMNLHITVPYGTNNHHIAEAIFKATARALRQAVSKDPRNDQIPSTKGSLNG